MIEVLAEDVSDPLKEVSVYRVVVPCPLFSQLEKPRVHEYVEVVGRKLLRDPQLLLDLANAALPAREKAHDAQPAGVRERLERICQVDNAWVLLALRGLPTPSPTSLCKITCFYKSLVLLYQLEQEMQVEVQIDG